MPDGLGAGGLQVARGALAGWQGADLPVQTVEGARHTVAIRQTAPRAILNWESFNVGRDTTLRFDQQASDAVLNRVVGADARPSQIQGAIHANGTVMVVNQNGVVFSGSSQVNVRSLVAAAASLTDSQFRDAGLYGADGAPVFTAARGAIRIERGARLETHRPGSVTQGGGYVLMLGQEVSNDGEIVTPRGQALLAAGDDFFIRQGYGTQGNLHSTTRGNEVAARRAPGGDTTGEVVNTGLIVAREGDVTLTGHALRQDGVAVATTTVGTRGTIHLLNAAGDAQGRVTLGEHATTAVLLQDEGQTALDSQREALLKESAEQDVERINRASPVFDNLSLLPDRRDLSRIEVVSGQHVDFASGSLTLATGGQLAVSAGARALLRDGATLDVAGAVGVKVAMASNNVLVNVQGNEQRDAPVNRDNGALNNGDVWIDRRFLLHLAAGTGGYEGARWYTQGGLLEVGGYLGNQPHGIGEWAAQGGTITLAASEVVTRAGSAINLAGGSLDVESGFLRQSWLLGQDGRLYEASRAPGSLPYQGVYRGYEVHSARWGVTRRHYDPVLAPVQRWEAGYTVGRDAGRLHVSAPTALLAGHVEAQAYQGGRQANARAADVDGYLQPQAAVARHGGLVIARIADLAVTPPFDTDIIVGAGHDVVPDDWQPLAAAQLGMARLDAAWLNGLALGELVLETEGDIRIAAPLRLADGGAISLQSPDIVVSADVTARGGSLRAGNRARDAVLLRDGDAAFTLAPGAVLDVSGRWTNQAHEGEPAAAMAHIDGGSVEVRMIHGSVRLGASSVVDVSSGAALRADGSLAGGRGGDVTLVANAGRTQDGDTAADLDRPGRELAVAGTLRAHGVAGAGTLTLSSPAPVVFGENAVLESGTLAAGMPLPADVILSAPVRLAAGSRAPVDVTLSGDRVPPGVPTTQPHSMAQAAVLAADWTVPQGIGRVWVDGLNLFRPGDTIPGGSAVMIDGTMPAGLVLPADAFPDGVTVTPFTSVIAAGQVLPQAFTLEAGRVLPRGAYFDDAIAFSPALRLAHSLLSSGFGNYRIESRAGMLVGDGIGLAPTLPVLRLREGAADLPRGAAASAALERWLAPPVIADPAAASAQWRAGADLSLHATSLEVAATATLAVDPGQALTLAAARQLIVDGTLRAPGGEIALSSAPIGTLGVEAAREAGASLWVGEGAVLDAAGRAWQGVDAQGRRHGLAQDGGAILIGLRDDTRIDADLLDASPAAVIIREGAYLDASGAAVTVDRVTGLRAGREGLTLAGAGGLIRLGSLAGIANDGTLRAAAGGHGAQGGTLHLALENQSLARRGVRRLVVTQQREASGLPAGLQPGQADEAWHAQARVSAQEIIEGGFTVLDLWSRDLIAFEGDVDLRLGQSLALRRGMLTVSEGTPAARVQLAAPQVLLAGKVGSVGGPSLPSGEPNGGLLDANGGHDGYPARSASLAATLRIDADIIDVRDRVYFGGVGYVYLPGEDGGLARVTVDSPGFDHVSLASRGDLRFTDGMLHTGGDMTLTARQLYPTTGASGQAVAGAIQFAEAFDGARTLAIRGHGGAPATPLSAFGTLGLHAANIDQGGIVRAPLGRIVFGTVPDMDAWDREGRYDVLLREGSLTSTSAAGLLMPYGGTSDGLAWRHAGEDVVFQDLAALGGQGRQVAGPAQMGVLMGKATLTAERGAVIDVSGGGTLTGAGFVTGRGGSVDVLRTSLAHANPVYRLDGSRAQVYAIVPSLDVDHAPVSPDAGAGMPQPGQRITLTEGAAGLPAGTYTLLPSTYALLPGAFRVELAGRVGVQAAPGAALSAGVTHTVGYLGLAGGRDALPTRILLMPADVVRQHSHYNETSYAAFAAANAARFGALRPRLERDAQTLHLDFGLATGQVLDFQGQVRMAGEGDGAAGNLFLTTLGALEIKRAAAAGTAGHASVNAEDLAGIEAGILSVGGIFSLVDAVAAPDAGGQRLGPRVVFHNAEGSVAVREGTILRAGQIFVGSRDRVILEGGSMLEAVAGQARAIDSRNGYVFADSANLRNVLGGAIVAVSASDIRFTSPTASDGSQQNAIEVADGARLRTPGTIAFSTNTELALHDAELNAHTLRLVAPSLHIGMQVAFDRADAQGVLGPGVRLSQSLLDRLLHPVAPGQVPIAQLALTAGGSVNLLDDVDFDLTRTAGGGGTALLLETPAVYGWGEAGATARLAAATVRWSGVSTGAGAPAQPFESAAPAPVVPGGPGSGAGALVIDAGRIDVGYAPEAQAQSQVALDRLALGFSSVTLRASERITASHRGTVTVYESGHDAGSYAGGDLHLQTPVLTGAAGSFMHYRAGGALTLSHLPGHAPAIVPEDGLGAEIQLSGTRLHLDGQVALPSGRLVLSAARDIALGATSVLDLSGRALAFFDVARPSWGGDVVMTAGEGAITQAAGGRIDVSAGAAEAGGIQASALGDGGVVSLLGTLLGAGGLDGEGGAIDVRAQHVDDFAGLNARLGEGGFFRARRYALGRGDWVIGDGVRARQVSISADGGSLTVAGHIDASGALPGDIRLSARDTLTLAGGAVLDTRATRLARDGRGGVIEASNRGRMELASTAGAIVLSQDARLDLRSPDGVARGVVVLNAPRVGTDDLAIVAGAPVTVLGAQGIIAHGMRSYTPADGRVTQDYLDGIHLDSVAYIDAARANAALADRLAGLLVHGDAFHLRPGVEIRSALPDGDLVVAGDLDFSAYRYGPGADPALRGAGEPGLVVLRAGGDLIVNGSISDGFDTPPATPDDAAFIRVPGGTTDVPAGTTRPDDWSIEADLTLLQDWVVPDTAFYRDGWGYIYDTSWNFYPPGATVPAGTTLVAWGAIFEAGTPLPSYTATLPPTDIAGRVWAAAPMLAPGSLSWSMRLVSGADLDAADARALRASADLDGRGDLVLDVRGRIGPQRAQEAVSVIRSGTGDLELLAGGSYRQESLFGVYTAGTQIEGAQAWDAGRARHADGTVLGAENAGYEATLAARRMYLTTGGGDLLLVAQGDLRGRTVVDEGGNASADPGQWLWRQGGGETGALTAWGVNFGQYWHDATVGSVTFAGFSGIGTLGGGNVSIVAGGDLGVTENLSFVDMVAGQATSALSVVVGASGRVDAQGRLHQEGGGRLSVTAGGRINTGLVTQEAGAPAMKGLVANVRGDIDIRAGAIGQLLPAGYGIPGVFDPRPADIFAPSALHVFSPMQLAVGDGQASVRTRAQAVVGTGLDLGRAGLLGGAAQPVDGNGDGSAIASFTLWTGRSGLDVFSAGGDVVQAGDAAGGARYDPGRFSATAGGGSVLAQNLLLAPSASGELALLARDHVWGRAAASGASPDSVASPERPFWLIHEPGSPTAVRATNAYAGGAFSGLEVSLYDISSGGMLFAFAPDTPHAGLAGQTRAPWRVYAREGDVSASLGRAYRLPGEAQVHYVAGAPLVLRAGRDIVGGSHVMLNTQAQDISVVRADRDLLNTSLRIGGPGLLDASAGRNVYQALGPNDAPDANTGIIRSLGPLVAGDERPGAGIVLSAGLRAGGLDLDAFAARYLDPANAADPGLPLADQPGRAVQIHAPALQAWMRARHGDAGEGGYAAVLARFLGLPEAERAIFLRGIYFEELRAGGREYNDPDSPRFLSYLRGREAIATLLPAIDASGPGAYQGAITLLGAAGVHTDLGGDIQVLAPGGGLVLGADGVAPPSASTGLLTQGRGDIQVFTRDSVQLGLSRIFTTFGGAITMWSVQGDINAGRGAKTTLVYTPPRRVYDPVGNVALAPQVPATGAGIATLAPIPEVAPGSVDLIAPLGTIDAGEAGIRSSGSVNVAALHVANAANIQAQGEVVGIPMAVAVNVGALTSASAAAASATTAAQETAQRARADARQNLPSIISVQILGFGEEAEPSAPPATRQGASARPVRYDPGASVQVLGLGEPDAAVRARLTEREARNLGL
ncbi:Filamentous haemagglutinin family outer membrane protein associated with VreARI signalling system [plant metagenome]|uniref:Filamentous haemagglutinin family outer membrane protein associated with VreARI signalling system n=1 Tax=plant metagenome TaxID=1297885 RepID=A0A484NTI0_9ZZZZ